MERAGRALSHFFRPGNLIALRELALRQVTHVVDRSLDAYHRQGRVSRSHRVFVSASLCASARTPRRSSLIARGSRMAQAIERRLLRGLYRLRTGHQSRGPADAGREHSLRRKPWRAVMRSEGTSVASTVAAVRPREPHHAGDLWALGTDGLATPDILYLSAIQRFLREAPSVDVHIVTQEAR